MNSTNKSPSQDNQKKPAFVALIKKNKPEPKPESSTQSEETSPKKTSSQSRVKKSTNSTTKSQKTKTSTNSQTKLSQSTDSTSSTNKSKQTSDAINSTSQSKSTPASTKSKQTSKTTTPSSQKKAQSTTTQKTSGKSDSKTSSNPPSKTQKALQANPNQKTQTKSAKTQGKSQAKSSQGSPSTSSKRTEAQSKLTTSKTSQNQAHLSQLTTSKTSQSQAHLSQSTSQPKNQDKKQKLKAKTNKKGQAKTSSSRSPNSKESQSKSATSQPKKPDLDPIQKALLYQNKKKQRLGISDYEDQISARDLSLSITGLSSIATGSALQAILAGSLMGIFSFPALLLLSTVLGKYVLQFHRTALDILREEEAERKIAQLLKDTYLDNGGEIYSILDDNPLIIPNPDEYEPDYLDIGLCLPSGQWLAISVKALKGKKDSVYIDQNTQSLRYRRARGVQRWGIYPLDELKRQIAWFKENTQIFKTSPLGIIVFMEPAKLKLFDDIALKFGETKVLCLDDIYIVQEKDLLDFIDAVQSRGKV